ncbi:signal transduction histidine kinase [Tamaricihabitans halophyticus]|uniref:histidine kinase n=1 Tax=Tamaricihabitans halophyticus TaxID=1262583 RepID=A0A4R2QLN8_9PSEU|nr:nitrate- and nitrite sensing domain-containing protein [Tamaricihabitans halophyticus]TCP47915.1 signal transduction histidine kinase [Tamaricihabitans halophyticus]
MTLAGQAESPEQPDERQAGSAGAAGSRLRWRDWSLAAKLAAVTVVPLLMAIVLGATTLGGQVDRANGYERIDRLIAVNSDVRTALAAVQAERDEVITLLNAGQPTSTPELSERRTAVDQAVGPLDRSTQRAVEVDGRIQDRYDDVRGAFEQLGAIRGGVDSDRLDALAATTRYSEITRALLNLDQAVVSRANDSSVGGSVVALHDLEAVKEELAVQKARIGAGIATSTMPASEIVELRTSDVRLNDRLDEFRAVASDQLVRDYDATVTGAEVATRNRLVRTLLTEQGVDVGAVVRGMSASEWHSTSTAAIDLTGQVTNRVGDQLSSTASQLRDDASSTTGLVAVLLFGALILAIAVVVIITRQLLRSLRALRRGAMEVAQQRLPEVVDELNAGKRPSEEIEPVKVHTKDEVGQVARAFDAVHRQALRLAIEQSSMRSGYSGVLVNLSRRSQSLVQRQLQLIEELERDEEDADQLATLFRLDHLATRMRRNNENLMVLSGSEPARRGGQPVALSDLLRAAVSEIEQYQRVTIQAPAPALIVGYAASDLLRLVAELLDNATAFSAPETQVTVASRVTEDGSVSIDVLDQGIGMTAEEVAVANERLSTAGSVTTMSSRRMGLFVVGRLASRHDIRVQLHGGKDIVGVRATVYVQAELVTAAVGDADTTKTSQFGPASGLGRFAAGGPSSPAEPPFAGGESAPGRPPIPSQSTRPDQPGELPRRRPPVNGTARSETLPGLLGSATSDPADSGTAQSGSGQSGQSGSQSASSDQPADPVVEAAHPRSANGVDDTAGADLFSPDVAAAGPDRPAQPAGSEDTGEAAAEEDGSTLSEWWASTTREQAARPAGPPAVPAARPESTPIFDEMLSAWFRTAQADPRPDAPQPAGTGQWSFAADAGWQAVESVTRAAPSSFTEAGLPRRKRGEQLMPGAVEPAAEQSVARSAELPRRDAREVYGRLSSFQRGVRRGRDENLPAGEASAASAEQQPSAFAFGLETSDPQPVRRQPAADAGRTANGAPPPETRPEDTVAAEAAGTAEPADTSEPASAPEPAQPASTEADPTEVDRAGSGTVNGTGESGPERSAAADFDWTFTADEGWHAAQQAAETAPASFTASGLPRRVRGEHLVPGAAVAESDQRVAGGDRSAQYVRGRLSSFQQGIRRGRAQVAQQAGRTDDESGG